MLDTSRDEEFAVSQLMRGECEAMAGGGRRAAGSLGTSRVEEFERKLPSESLPRKPSERPE